MMHGLEHGRSGVSVRRAKASSFRGVNPTWQLLLQPVAIGAVREVTNSPKPPVDRVASATPRAGRPERA